MSTATYAHDSSTAKVSKSKSNSTPLRVNKPGDAYEQEADRVADLVGRGERIAGWSLSSTSLGQVQRQTPPPGALPDPTAKPLTTDDIPKKVGEALLETKEGKAAVNAIKKDPLVKSTTDFLKTPAGIVIAGSAATGMIAGLAKAGKPLPLQVPKLPLDFIHKGLAVQLKYEGPVNRPTAASITLSFTPSADKKKDEKPNYRAEADELRASMDMFRDKRQDNAGLGPVASPQQPGPSALPAPDVITGADPAASRVTQSPPPAKADASANPADTKHEDDNTVQRKAASTLDHGGTYAGGGVQDALRGHGRPLDADTRRLMESRIGCDFRKVKVFTDSSAADSARDLNARAYTVGSNIVFDSGKYQPHSSDGKKLLAHELAHVVQQNSNLPTRGAANLHAPQPSKEVAASSSLRIGPAHDSFEQEADWAAEKVASGEHQHVAWSLSRVALGAVQRECSCGGTCDDCKKKKEVLQRNASSSAAVGSHAPASVASTLSRPGSSLDPGARSFMESRFGHDFSSVRIHTDDHAAASARDVSANAYTVGSSIVFNQGKYQPHTSTGRRLLAHELAHVVQQSQGVAPAQIQRDESEVQVIEGPQSNSVLQQAFNAADARRWEVAARLANGLSPYEMKIFLSQYPQPMWRHQLHIGAVSASGVGEKSAIALATEAESAAFQKKEDFKYRERLAKQNGEPPPKEGDPAPGPAQPAKPLTVAEKKQKCNATSPADSLVFPLLLPKGLTQFDSAPIHAERVGKQILISQPMNEVKGTRKFNKETHTLPLQVFTGGIKIEADDVVKVRMYDAGGKYVCVSGEEMLKISDASDKAVGAAMIGTAAQALAFMAPGASNLLAEQGVGKLTATLVTEAASASVGIGGEALAQQSLVDLGIQDKIHWKSLAFEFLLRMIMAKFAPDLTHAIMRKAAGVLNSPVSRAVVESAIAGGAGAIQTTAQTLFSTMAGENKEITVGGFIEELAWAFVQGAGMHLLLGSSAYESEHASNTPRGPNGEPIAPPKIEAAPTQEHAVAPARPEPKVNQPAQNKPPVHADAHPDAHAPAAKKAPASEPHMEPESAKSPKSIPKEEAIATEQLKVPGEKEDHQIVGSKDGLGRCSPDCPAIPIVYAKELADNPKFAARYAKIRALGEKSIKLATREAARLARDIEEYRAATGDLSHEQMRQIEILEEFGEQQASVYETAQHETETARGRKPTGKSGGGMQEKPRHHVFPQEHRKWFQRRGFKGSWDIDNFTVKLDPSAHQAVHGGGDYKLGRTTKFEWNAKVMDTLRAQEKTLGRQLKRAEVFSIVEGLMKQYKIPKRYGKYKQ